MSCICNTLSDSVEIDWNALFNTAASAAGSAVQNQSTQNIYPECGKRPFFTGRRRNEWDQCVAGVINGRGMPGAPGTSQTGTVQSFFEKNKTTIYIGGAALVGFLIYKQYKKR